MQRTYLNMTNHSNLLTTFLERALPLPLSIFLYIYVIFGYGVFFPKILYMAVPIFQTLIEIMGFDLHARCTRPICFIGELIQVGQIYSCMLYNIIYIYLCTCIVRTEECMAPVYRGLPTTVSGFGFP